MSIHFWLLQASTSFHRGEAGWREQFWLCWGLQEDALILQGDHSVGKYRCLLCQKEFSSESGVKYHIIKAHSEVRTRLGLVQARSCSNVPVPGL